MGRRDGIAEGQSFLNTPTEFTAAGQSQFLTPTVLDGYAFAETAAILQRLYVEPIDIIRLAGAMTVRFQLWRRVYVSPTVDTWIPAAYYGYNVPTLLQPGHPGFAVDFQPDGIALRGNAADQIMFMTAIDSQGLGRTWDAGGYFTWSVLYRLEPW